MTTDQEETGGDDPEDQDLDLEKLFESIPTEDLDGEADLEESPLEAEPSDSNPTDPEAGDAGVEDSGQSGRPGRFDRFIDRMGDSTADRPRTSRSDKRSSIQELLGRMGGDESSAGADEPADDGSFIDVDSSELQAESGKGTDDSPTGPSAPESKPSRDLDTETLKGVENLSDVLFKSSRSSGGDVDVCQPFFSLSSPTDQNVLLVSLRQSSEDRLNAFYAGAEDTPDNLAVITSNDAVRSTTTAAGGDGADSQSNIIVKVVNDPGDLTRLGITISNVLSSWQGNGNHTLVCFDSLSSLLQYADLQRVFRFVHVLQGRLGNVDATTHYHLDPEAHDSQTQATMRSLFDGVITVSDTGELGLE